MKSTAVSWVFFFFPNLKLFTSNPKIPLLVLLDTVNDVLLPAGHGGAAVSCQHRELWVPLGAAVPAGGSGPLRQDEEGRHGEDRAAGSEAWSVDVFSMYSLYVRPGLWNRVHLVSPLQCEITDKCQWNRAHHVNYDGWTFFFFFGWPHADVNVMFQTFSHLSFIILLSPCCQHLLPPCEHTPARSGKILGWLLVKSTIVWMLVRVSVARNRKDIRNMLDIVARALPTHFMDPF